MANAPSRRAWFPIALWAAGIPMVLGCGKRPGPEPIGPPVAGQPVAPLNAGYLNDAVRNCIAGVAADIDAIKGRYPGLTAWRGAETEINDTGISYKHKFKGWAKSEESMVEPGGCLILLDVRGTEQLQWIPRYRLYNLDRNVYVFVQGDKELVSIVEGIIEKRLAPLVALDRSRGRPLSPPTTGEGTQKLSATVHALSGEDLNQVADRADAGTRLFVCPVGKTPVHSWVERVAHADRHQGEMLDESNRAWLLFRAPDFSAPDQLDKVFAVTRAERAGNSIVIECRLSFYSGPWDETPPPRRPLVCVGLDRLPPGEYQVTAVVRYFSYAKTGKPEDAKPVAEGAAPSLMQYKLAFRVRSFAERLMADPKLDKREPLVRFTVENYDGSQHYGGRMIVANGRLLMGSDETGLDAVRKMLAELPAVAERVLGRGARVRAEVAEPEEARLKPLAESIRAEIKRAGLDGAPEVEGKKSD